METERQDHGYAFRFPRPDGCGNPFVYVTAKWLLSLQAILRDHLKDDGLTFAFQINGMLYKASGKAPDPFGLGDLVSYKSATRNVLRCGSGAYSHAVVRF